MKINKYDIGDVVRFGVYNFKTGLDEEFEGYIQQINIRIGDRLFFTHDCYITYLVYCRDMYVNVSENSIKKLVKKGGI